MTSLVSHTKRAPWQNAPRMRLSSASSKTPPPHCRFHVSSRFYGPWRCALAFVLELNAGDGKYPTLSKKKKGENVKVLRPIADRCFRSQVGGPSSRKCLLLLCDLIWDLPLSPLGLQAPFEGGSCGTGHGGLTEIWSFVQAAYEDIGSSAKLPSIVFLFVTKA